MEEKMKMQSLENRVKRLEFEDERCRKMEASANIKAEKMIENRRRHYEDMLLKKNHSLQVQLIENMQREENQIKRDKTKSTI